MTTTLDTSAIIRQAADDLAAVREQWGDLLAAIERPPATEWPPREARGFLDQLAAAARTEDGKRALAPAIGRVPLVLREHPAPLNLDAVDAAVDVERALFELADTIAAAVQRPVRRRVEYVISGRMGKSRSFATVDGTDRDDPARWRIASPADPGSRTYGLHWAAVWVEDRITGQDVGDLHAAVPVLLLDEAAGTASTARRTVERALGRDGRTIKLDRPCPWCGGRLLGRTQPGGEPSVACTNGRSCRAPVLLDRGRRTWRGADLVGLYVALAAKDQCTPRP
ncbi:hypothetical protein [Streptomyces sp. NPDC058394]|uniref:hypothetical protein n=1 Tax=Streptomyces sp. NPDC058394 TaxID=3346477 RepID=UPI0036563052